jgi:hypothetical protein
MIGQTISQYGIIEKFAEDVMGVVYNAQDTKQNTRADHAIGLVT